MKQKCFEIMTKRAHRSQQFQLHKRSELSTHIIGAASSDYVCTQFRTLSNISSLESGWANAVEQSAWTASATRHHTQTIQTIIENVCVWL